jgi:monovalent cation:H+ antiporter-2, CPA2 family
VHSLPILRDLVLLVAIAIPVVAIAQRFKVPTVVAYLLTGIALGPAGLGVMYDTESVNQLAEVGVLLLLFGVGLELSFSRVAKMGRDVLIGGAGQVLGTMALVAAVMMTAGTSLNRAVFIGALIAVSSTAILLKVYQQRSELDSPHGRVVVAIAVFQDLAVVPLMLMIPLLAGTSGGGTDALRDIGISLAAVAAIIVIGRLVVPRALERIVRLRNRELFTLSVVFVGLGAAFVASRFGLSLALGAFLAGLVVSESEYGLQALSDVLPFRDAFSGIFFVSVGMLLDPEVVVRAPLLLAAVALGIVVLKAVVASAAIRLLGRPFETAVIGGIGLAQVGEFSFVLAGAGVAAGLLPGPQYQLFLAGAVISMMIAPFAIAAALPVAEWLARRLHQPALDLRTVEEVAVGALKNHVIVVGYGLNGRNVARALRAAGVPYVVLEQNGQVVRDAREAGEPILFGDGANAEVLSHVGIARARVVVFAIATPEQERRGVAVARQLNRHAHIVVRTRYVASMDELVKAGANEVVPEEFTTSLELFARVLRHLGMPVPAIRRLVETTRRDHYRLFAEAAPRLSPLHQLGALGVELDVDTLDVPPGSPVIGENPVTLKLRSRTGAMVLAVLRESAVLHEVDRSFRFAPLDLVVMVGTEEALGKARALFTAAAEVTE